MLIVWDWNGTLLDDVAGCLSAMNILLERRGMPALDRETYRNIFTFPVREYYRALGFDFKREPFEKLAVEFIELYSRHSRSAVLQPGAREALEYFQIRGCSQVILSAQEQEALERQVDGAGIRRYFHELAGLNNIYAGGKMQIAGNLLEKSALDKERVLFIGDTRHDYEIARELGCHCILVACGHQNLENFRPENVPVFPHLGELINSCPAGKSLDLWILDHEN